MKTFKQFLNESTQSLSDDEIFDILSKIFKNIEEEDDNIFMLEREFADFEGEDIMINCSAEISNNNQIDIIFEILNVEDGDTNYDGENFANYNGERIIYKDAKDLENKLKKAKKNINNTMKKF